MQPVAICVTMTKNFFVLYISRGSSTEGVKERAEYIVNDLMRLNKREELNCLYLDDIRYALKNNIPNYKRVEFADPSSDIELENDKVVMLDALNISVLPLGGA